MFRIVRSSFHSDFDYAQDDTAGLENIKFVYFSDSRGRLSLQLKGCVHTYFVGVGALDDPKKQSIIAAQTPSALCALKTSRWKFFGATFFSKKVAKK